MKAMLLRRPGLVESLPLSCVEVSRPEPQGNEIRVRVQACGVCRTDLHVVEGELPPHRQEIIPGHQIAGVVDAAGPDARRFNLGDRVGVAWLRSTCGTCRYCQRGDENLCPNAQFTGYDEDGGYAEYAVVREDFAYALPEGLDTATATPLLCAGIIGYRALMRANTRPGCRLGLYGFGSSAHISIQVARHWGCKVYVMTRDPRQQMLARELGAEWAGGANEFPPESLDSAVLFAPAGDLVPVALEALDKGGTLSLAGIYLTDIPVLKYQQHLFHEKNLCSVTANTRRDGEALLRLATEIPLHPKTTSFQLKEANEALQRLKSDGIRGSGVLIIAP
jgi:alcohol dehydrogenase, propanol-preferring